jgi:NitT/TauT family transport system substrate-binding protein
MKRLALACVLTAGLGVTSACGGADDQGTADSGGLTTLVVGVSPSTTSLPLYLAQQGIFEKHGLKVELKTIQSGAEAIPQLLNGSLDIALGDAAGTLSAASNGVPLRAIGIATVGPEAKDDDFSAIATNSDSIKSAADLEGKTVAVNQAGGSAELTARAAVDASGGDSTKVEFVELAFPEMVGSVKAGRVDGAVLVEPFVAAATAEGLNVDIRPQALGTPDIPSTIFVSSAKEAAEKSDAITAFDDAITEAVAATQADADQAVTVAATYTGMTTEQLAATRLPTFFTPTADVSSMNSLLDLMNKYELLAKQPDMGALLGSGS